LLTICYARVAQLQAIKGWLGMDVGDVSVASNVTKRVSGRH
jgi:hypothetical protein